LLAAHENAEAFAVLHQTAELAPSLPEAALALGEALLASGHLPTAIAEFERALRLDPNLARARFALGVAWVEAGEPDRASEILASMKETPELASEVSRALARAEAMRAASRAPEGYVRHLFDQFSPRYDEQMLGNLSYRAPFILRELAGMVLQLRPKAS